MTVRLLIALVLLAAPAARAQPTPVPGGAGVSARDIAFHDGRVTFLRVGENGAGALVRLDPATGRAAETPLPAPGEGVTYGSLHAIGGRLYATTLNADTYENGPLVALDGPGFRPVPAPALDALDLSTAREAGGRTFASLPATDPSSSALAEISADGHVAALEPPPPPGDRSPLFATPLGDAVYFAVEALAGDDYLKTLWRAAGGQSAPADVLPAGAGDVSGVAAAAGALLVASRDRETTLVHVFRLAPGAARATPVPGFETWLGFSEGLFRTVGDVLFFTAPDPDGDRGGDAGPRLRLYRTHGTAAPERVPGLDLGTAGTFFPGAVRVFDGALFVAGYTPDDADPYGTKQTLFRVGADGPAVRVARIDHGSPQISGSNDQFVVAGERLYLVVQSDDGDDVLVSMPLDGGQPAAARRP